MTSTDAAGFDPALLETVARDRHVDPGRLTTLAADLQAAAESVRGVDGLVFEYRKSFGDVVVGRTETAYYLAVPPHVWPEFAALLDATDAELAALRDAHTRRFEAAVGDGSDLPDGTPLVLQR